MLYEGIIIRIENGQLAMNPRWREKFRDWLPKKVKATPLRVALHLTSYSDEHGKVVFPSVARMAEELAVSEDTISRSIAALEAAQVLVVMRMEPFYDEKNATFTRPSTNRYFFVLPAEMLLRFDFYNTSCVPDRYGRVPGVALDRKRRDRSEPPSPLPGVTSPTDATEKVVPADDATGEPTANSPPEEVPPPEARAGLLEAARAALRAARGR